MPLIVIAAEPAWPTWIQFWGSSSVPPLTLIVPLVPALWPAMSWAAKVACPLV